MRTLLITAALLGSLHAAQAAAPTAISYGQNLIVNGDAEAGTAGWLSYDSYTFIQAVSYGNNWVKPSEPGPVNRGKSMFTGTGANAVAYQLLDLGQNVAQPTSYALSGWLGGWASQQDNAAFAVTFLDQYGGLLGSATIGPVTPQDRGNSTGLWLRSSSGQLPVGTRQLGFWLSMERFGGNDNDGYADNLSFVLNAPAPVPEPATAVLSLLGLGLLLRRKAQG
ncbi:PEP-CTERM sorting domain-containing protein [Paucibacter sp. APW11]|uniref:PEP-CTERM sorting domain-containing protein n=1 Tax=Roseateles aquae TaxID=3077235 RepID=A0ABU3PDR0_9BURK|nr:PEP-CTERM sorting domain-containing protein [Paucibacter sp. APW11]MDT9000735.1 PEP-CTERM sorting domain-containing protein [Paucibacter sp. APW11]